MSMSSEEFQGHLKKAYLETFKDDDITHAQRFKHVLELLLQTTGSILLSPLSYYLNILREFDKTQLTNMTPEEKIKCKQRLYITYLLLLQDKETRQADVECCADLLDNLDLDIQIMPDEMPKKIKFIEYAHAYPGKPAAYTGIQTGLCLGQRSMDILTWVNEKRLYWVWGGGLLRTVLSLLQEDFYNQQNATLVATAPSRFTGYLSWSLYFARFALNSFLLINDTFSPELTEKEREMGKWAYWERFRTQWSLRKFTLLNDFFWGIANMVCFFWLHGSDGDALTLSLLIFDIGITLWDFMEQETKFNKDHDDYEEKIKGLIKKREVILDKDVVAQINLDLNKLFREQTQCKTHWDNKKMALVSNMIYAFGLFIAFALLTMPFMPFAPAILLITGVIGSVLCFTMTVIAGIIKGSLAIQSSRLSSKDTADYCQEKISLFAADNSSADDMKKICLFMEIRQLMTESDYQKQMVQYQTMNLIRTTIIQSLIPMLMFVSFVFLPMGIGFAVMAAVLALAIVSHLYIEKEFGAEKTKFSEFDNDDYDEFCDAPTRWVETHSKSQHAFFQSNKQKGKNVEEDNLELVPLLRRLKLD